MCNVYGRLKSYKNQEQLVSFKEVEDAGGRVLACAYEVLGWVGKMAVWSPLQSQRCRGEAEGADVQLTPG